MTEEDRATADSDDAVVFGLAELHAKDRGRIVGHGMKRGDRRRELQRENTRKNRGETGGADGGEMIWSVIRAVQPPVSAVGRTVLPLV